MKSFTDALNALQQAAACNCGTFACMEWNILHNRQSRYTMRLTRLYQVFDNLAQTTAGAIFPEKRDAPAVRAFHALFEREGTLPAQYPENFELRCVGVQDEETGQITAESPPQTIATGTGWLDARTPRIDKGQT